MIERENPSLPASNGPNLIKDPSLEDATYEIDFDLQKFKTFIDKYSPEAYGKISNITLTRQIENSALSALRPLASVDRFSTELKIYGDNFWNLYEKNLYIAEQVLERKKKPPKTKFKHVSTKKLPRYLAIAPEERAWDFTQRLLLESLNNYANQTLVHETKHAMETGKFKSVDLYLKCVKLVVPTTFLTAMSASKGLTENIYWGIADGTAGAACGIVWTAAFFLSGGYHAFDLAEFRARQFEKKHTKDLHGEEILTFKPKKQGEVTG